MPTHETTHLALRPYKEEDFTAVHSYAKSAENTTYMLFGPNTEEETRNFIAQAIAATSQTPIQKHMLAVTLKETGTLIGGCLLSVKGDNGDLSWILHQDHWNQGYGTQLAKHLIAFGFESLNLRRITATACSENHGSYRIMEKAGMRREGMYQDYRPARKGYHKEYYDEYQYAILKSDWDTQKEIAHYNALPCHFTNFIDVPTLTDGNIYLVCKEKYPANPEKKYVPSYNFAICKKGEIIGYIGLRIGYTDGLYYGGQIGYGVDEAHRGQGYAVTACRLIIPVAKAHGMETLLITNNYTNTPSMRVCEKLGAKLIRKARLPEWADLYKEGQRFSNIYEWSIK